MTTTTTGMDIGNEPADSSGATGVHPDLIRQIAERNPWMSRDPNDTSGTGQSALNPTSREDTAVGFNQFTPVTLLPDEPWAQSAEASFYPLQEWEGYVISVAEETFTARLIDLSANDEVEEEADFLITDLSAADQSELRTGAVFRWVIGHRRTRSDNKDRVSRVVLRRLPAWTESELEQIRQEAKALASALQGE